MTSGKLKLVVGTWNVGSQDPQLFSSTRLDCKKWIHTDVKPQHDLYVMGLQEIEMTARSLVSEQTDARHNWELVLKSAFNYDQNFTQIFCHQMVGLMLCVYCRTEHVEHVTNMKHCIERTGFKGNLGNKGAIAVRFELYGTKFCFINFHLEAHSHNLLERNKTLNKILELDFNSGNQYKPKNHDYCFLLGDFNYRIDTEELDYDDVQRKVVNKSWQILLLCDQLTKQKKRGIILSEFNEGKIEFAPTYKYKLGSTEYSKKKKRIPSWTDRVFWYCKDSHSVEILSYGRTESLLSDHRPVSAEFYVTVNQKVQRKLPPVPKILKIIRPEEMTAKEATLLDFSTFSNTTSKIPKREHPDILVSNPKFEEEEWEPFPEAEKPRKPITENQIDFALSKKKFNGVIPKHLSSPSNNWRRSDSTLELAINPNRINKLAGKRNSFQDLDYGIIRSAGTTHKLSKMVQKVTNKMEKLSPVVKKVQERLVQSPPRTRRLLEGHSNIDETVPKNLKVKQLISMWNNRAESSL